jgi:hypothetical protein
MMLWIIALAVPVLGAAIHLVARAEPASAEAIGTIGLLWFAAAFYGVVTFVAGLQHLIAPDRIAKYIGWPTGSGFQRELGWATVGIGAAGILAPWLGPLYALGPCVAGVTFSLGAAIGHAQEIRKTGNLNPGNAGPVFYVDILAPLFTVVAIWLATPWR